MGNNCCTSTDYLKDDKKFIDSSPKSIKSGISKINSMVNSQTSLFLNQNDPQNQFSLESGNISPRDTFYNQVDAAEVGRSYFRNFNNLNKNVKIDAANISNFNGDFRKNCVFRNRPSSPQFSTINNPLTMKINYESGVPYKKYIKRQGNYNTEIYNLTMGDDLNFTGFGNDKNVSMGEKINVDDDYSKYLVNNGGYSVA